MLPILNNKIFLYFLLWMRAPLRLIILLAWSKLSCFLLVTAAARPLLPIGCRNVYASIYLIIGQSLLWTPAASESTFTIRHLRYCILNISFPVAILTQIKACCPKKVPRLPFLDLWMCQQEGGVHVSEWESDCDCATVEQGLLCVQVRVSLLQVPQKPGIL